MKLLRLALPLLLPLAASGAPPADERDIRPAGEDTAARCAGRPLGRKVALVVGNQSYQYVPGLGTPLADARDVRAALRGVGFEVLEGGDDVTSGQLRDLIEQLEARIEPCGVVFFWYGGHAHQIGGTNWLATVNAQKTSQDAFVASAVPLSEVYAAAERGGAAVRIAAIDACRDDPFPTRWRGLDDRLLVPDRTPTGSLTVFSTVEGARAVDGSGRNSPFAAAFLAHVREGASARTLFSQVRADTWQATRGQEEPQVPVMYDSLIGDFAFVAPPDPALDLRAAIATAAGPLQASASEAWVRALGMPEAERAAAVRAFVERHAALSVVVGGQAFPVVVPEVAAALGWLAEHAVAPTPIRVLQPAEGGLPIAVGPSGYRARVLPQGDIAMGETEVWQALFTEVMEGYAPFMKEYEGVSLISERFPAQGVTWCDAVVFANRLSVRDGLPEAYLLPPGFEGEVMGDAGRCNALQEEVVRIEGAPGWRLPTEEEWVLAATAGGVHREFVGTEDEAELCEYANIADAGAKERFGWSWAEVCDDGAPALAEVGSYAPNAWDLHDMGGNVWEWTEGREGSHRVVRGGSGNSAAGYLRPAYRSGNAPGVRSDGLGFRLLRSI